jgi:hypothetical protein
MSRFFISLLLLSLLLFNCGIPNDPEDVNGGDGGFRIVSKTKTAGYAQDVVIKDTLLYIAQGEGGLAILNVSDPRNPVRVSSVFEQLKGYFYKIARKDSAVYLAAGNFGMSVVNIADPYAPFVTVTNTVPRPTRDLIVHGEYLLTASSEMGVGIAKITDATYPDPRGGMEVNGYARGLCVSPDSSFLLVASGEMGLTLLDIKDMQNGFGIYPKLGWVDTDGYANDVVCHPELPYAYIACGIAGISVVDYSDTSDMKVISKFATGGYAKELAYKDGFIYVATETRGMQVIDVRNVNNLVRTANVKTRYAKGICLQEKYIYIADEQEGIIIIQAP